MAKNLKTPEDLGQFDRLPKKMRVEAVLNAEMTHHLGYEKNQPKSGTNSRNAGWREPLQRARFCFQPGIDRKVVRELAFAGRRENVILLGHQVWEKRPWQWRWG